MFAKLRQWIAEHRAAHAFERVERAIRYQARMASEAEFHRSMTDWYTKQVDGIDPHTDWHGFAAVKQKEHDHMMEFGVYRNRASEAQAAANARMTTS